MRDALAAWPAVAAQAESRGFGARARRSGLRREARCLKAQPRLGRTLDRLLHHARLGGRLLHVLRRARRSPVSAGRGASDARQRASAPRRQDAAQRTRLQQPRRVTLVEQAQHHRALLLHRQPAALAHGCDEKRDSQTGSVRRLGRDDVAARSSSRSARSRGCQAGAMFGLSGAELAAAEQDAARALAAADVHLQAAERQLRAPRPAPPLAPGGAWLTARAKRLNTARCGDASALPPCDACVRRRRDAAGSAEGGRGLARRVARRRGASAGRGRRRWRQRARRCRRVAVTRSLRAFRSKAARAAHQPAHTTPPAQARRSRHAATAAAATMKTETTLEATALQTRLLLTRRIDAAATRWTPACWTSPSRRCGAPRATVQPHTPLPGPK